MRELGIEFTTRLHQYRAADFRRGKRLGKGDHIAQQFIERAQTSIGLRVTVGLLNKVYAIGRKYADDFQQNLKILFEDHLPKWNYRAVPQPD